MSFSIKSIGHALSVGLSDAYKGAKAVETFLEKSLTPQNEKTIEDLTALVPKYGPPAALIERGAFAVAGEVAHIISNLENAGEQKLLDAGFDAQVIADFKALIASVPGLLSAKVVS